MHLLMGLRNWRTSNKLSAICRRQEVGYSITEPLVLRDQQEFTTALSQEKFDRIITRNLPGLELTESADSATLLFDIFNWHASFPFTASGVQHVDGNAFLRAVCLLTRDSRPPYGPNFSAGCHGVSSGTWGPHSGWFIHARGRDVNDFNRWLFRSLAVTRGTRMIDETKILIPRFIMYQSHQDSDGEPEQQVVVMEKESEQAVDILDVLAECPPEVDRLTANPLRESYELVLSSLQPQSHDLTDLRLPATKLVSLLRLLQAAQEGEKQASMASLTEKLGGESELSWERFNTAVSTQAVILLESNIESSWLKHAIGNYGRWTV